MALDLPLTEERQLIRDSIDRLVADKPRPTWRDLVNDLGLAGLTAPEAAGGFGGDIVDLVLVTAALAPSLASADWLPHAAATLLLGEVAPDHSVLPALAQGHGRAALVCPATAVSQPIVEADGRVRGDAELVAGGACADWILIANEDAIILVDGERGQVGRQLRIMRDSSTAADLSFAAHGTEAKLLVQGKQAAEASERITDIVMTARCAEAVALMARMISDTAGYLQQREQFGQPIARFQVLRHRLANMQFAMMAAGALTEEACLALNGRSVDQENAVRAACVETIDAARIVGEGAVQLHGAMGLTEELDLGGRYKRALAIAAGLGRSEDHLMRFAA